MKLTVQDLAALMSGATIIMNECSIQVFCGGVNGQGEGEEEEAGCYQTTAIGFVQEECDDEFDEADDEVEEDRA